MSFEYNTPAIEKWKLDIFMNVIGQFEDDLAEKTHHKMLVDTNYQTILLHIAGKSILTVREILTLCAHGYPDGALSLARNLYEQMMIVTFFEMHKKDADFHKYIEDFFLHYEVQRNKCLRDIEQYIPDEEKENLDKEYDELKERANFKINGDYWWARCGSFSKFVSCIMKEYNDKEIKWLLGVQYARYKRACVSLHASCMGNSKRLGNDFGLEVIDPSPTIQGHSTPLVYSAISLIYIIGVVCSYFQIDDTEYLKELNELAIFYQKEEKH